MIGGSKVRLIDLHLNRSNCNYANAEKEKLGLLYDYSATTYEELFEKWFMTGASYIKNNRIMIAKEEIILNQCEYVPIRDVMGYMGIKGNTYYSYEEKKYILNMIQGYLLDELKMRIGKSPLKILLALNAFLEYNRFLTGGLLNCLGIIYLQGAISEELLPIEEMPRAVINSMKIAKMLPCFNFAEKYKEIEVHLARDRQCLEYGINYILANYDMSFKDFSYLDTKEYNNISISVLQILRSIEMLRIAFSLYINGQNKKLPLKINDNGDILIDTFKFGDYENEYIKEMSGNRVRNINKEHIAVINDVAEEVLGASLSKLNRFVELILDQTESPNLLLFGKKKDWINTIQNELDLKPEKATKLFENLVHGIEPNTLYLSENKKPYRVMRQPIMKIDDFYFCPGTLLSYALTGHDTDFRFGTIKEEKIKKRLEKTYNAINDEFEGEVLNILKKKYPDARFSFDVKEKTIKINNVVVQLPGQIDILMYVNEVLFVIECKNLNLAINQKEMANQYQRFSKKYQNKLAEKIRVLNENLYEVITFITGEEASNISNIEVRGLIVLSDFSLTIFDDTIKYPVYTLRQVSQTTEIFDK